MKPRRRSTPKICLTLVAVIVATLIASAAPAAAERVQIRVLSNRADLVSGGQALTQIVLPRGTAAASARVTLNGHDVTSAFAVRPNGAFEGLLTRLVNGRNAVAVHVPGGYGARLTIVNHPVGGPVFSGPQIQPWVCGTQAAGLGSPTDNQCDAPTAVSYQYKSSATGQFASYNPASPPPDLATTTTDQGHTVPYIVRVEEGTQDRGLYQLAVLDDPGKPWTPWAAQPGWNHKLLVPFGASTSMHHSQDAPTGVLDDSALSRGFMVADSGLNVQGSDANANVSAEALLMLKEHIIDAFGPIRYTIGNGCSGGGLQQYMVASMYPGLLDGLQPNCSFADMWSTAPDVGECHALVGYFQNNPSQPWVSQIDGHRDPSDCEAWNATFWPAIDPTRASNCNLPQSEVYDPNTNPTGTRCALQDYQIDIWGRRPASEWGPVEKKIGQGFAERPFDNVGVQYGLKALRAGQITPAEFADLNAKAGGADIDGNTIPQRDEMDARTAQIAYRTGQITDARQLNDVPIIDLRGYSETAEIHTSVYSYTMRARLDHANGNHANQIIWTWQAYFPIVGMSVAFTPDIGLKSLLLIDKWLGNIEADHRAIPKAQKVRQDKPSQAVDGCFPNTTQAEVTNAGTCKSLFPPYDTTRTAAGGPLSNDVIKCQLKPLQRGDYPGIAFTSAEFAQLQQAFPTGVCDYTKPSIGQQPSKPWMSFQAGPGGRPLGGAPVSSPFGPASARRHRAGCPAATGVLNGLSLGPVTLGTPRALVRRAFVRSAVRSSETVDVFCLNRPAIGIRVGYPPTRLLARLPRVEQARLRGRAVLALTANRRYALKGVRAGATLAAARYRLRLGAPLHMGHNVWFLIANGRSMGVLKVRGPHVQEVGIALKAVTESRPLARSLLAKF